MKTGEHYFSDAASEINGAVEQFFEDLGINPDSIGEVGIEVVSPQSSSEDSGEFSIRRFGEHNLSNDQTSVFPEVGNLSHRIAEGNFSDVTIDKDQHTPDAVHEKAHDIFHRNYDQGNLPEDFTMDDFQDAKQRFFEYKQNNPEEAIESKGEEGVVYSADFFRKISEFQRNVIEEQYGKEEAQEFEKMIGIRGVDETAARTLQAIYSEGEAEVDQLYQQLDPLAYNTKMTDVLGVKREELVDYIESNSYDSFLSMTEEELLDRFYDPLPE